MHIESENNNGKKNAWSTLSTAIGVSRIVRRLYTSGKPIDHFDRFVFVNQNKILLFFFSIISLGNQVTVWGDYGRIEGKKVFMGVAQINLDNLNLSNIVIGWYRLFGTTSMVSGPPNVALSRRSSISSLDSLKLNSDHWSTQHSSKNSYDN